MGVVNIIEDYNQLFDIVWHTDGYGNKVNLKRINEQHQVIGNIVLLNEIPDEFRKVVINNMYELKRGSKIKHENEFIVDYLTGAITFHESKEGSTINIDEYYGRGIIKSYAVRNLLLDRKGNWESNNVEDLAHEIRQYIDGNRNELNLDVADLQEQINSNKIDIDNKYVKHKDGIADKHKAEDVTYDGEVENCLNVKDAIDSLQGQASTILEEIIDARKGEEDLASKVNDIDSNISNLSNNKADISYVDDEVEALGDDLNDNLTNYKNTTNTRLNNIDNSITNLSGNKADIEYVDEELETLENNLTGYKTTTNEKLNNINSEIESLSEIKIEIANTKPEVTPFWYDFSDNTKIIREE